MINKENIIITNVESTEIIQQYVVREIKKVLDKYKNIDKKEIRSVDSLVEINSIILISGVNYLKNLRMKQTVLSPSKKV